MKTFKTTISVNGKNFDTLADILPVEGKLKILFIAKTPANVSVDKGHYFQGTHGRMFWNKLAEYNIFNPPFGEFEDDYLLKNNYGMTDIVKFPRDYGNEPSDEEYKNGLERILKIIKKHKPAVIVFVYKTVLDKVMKLRFGITHKSAYGFNPQFENYFKAKVFVFPMPGTPCKTEDGKKAMTELKILIQ
jgi:mismatch-specific thymine-DNA glycosylase